MVVMAYGRRSKHSRTSWMILSSETLPVPKVLIEMDVGWATPMAYDTWISQRSARPAATMFLAT
ncbi:hypothetical protein D3C79_1087110 [compost metagenome]